MDAWAKNQFPPSSDLLIKQELRITEQQNSSSEADSDNDEAEPGMLDIEIMQLLNSDTEDEEFDGFTAEN